MIQYVQVDVSTHSAVSDAARAAGVDYSEMLALIISMWAAQRSRQPTWDTTRYTSKLGGA